jgi:hypothetical protein
VLQYYFPKKFGELNNALLAAQMMESSIIMVTMEAGPGAPDDASMLISLDDAYIYIYREIIFYS